MDPILLKYRGNDNEYLIYDTGKFQSALAPRAVRSLCARNFGLGTKGVMVGPIAENGRLVMKIYSPDGEEKQMEKDALAAGHRFLQDAGYIPSGTERSQAESTSRAFAVGKIFLSEEFVKTYLRTA